MYMARLLLSSKSCAVHAEVPLPLAYCLLIAARGKVSQGTQGFILPDFYPAGKNLEEIEGEASYATEAIPAEAAPAAPKPPAGARIGDETKTHGGAARVSRQR